MTDSSTLAPSGRLARSRSTSPDRLRHAHSGTKVLLDKLLVIATAPATILLGAGVAAAIALFDGGPVVYRHQRIGLNGARFTCLKFRTMRLDADEMLDVVLDSDPARRHEWQSGRKLRRDPRVTRLGQFLRDTSLDELPQLVNVLRGDMSLVGPRPIVASELSEYRRHAATYRSVRPGLTGLWQVTRADRIDYRTRVASDVWYVRHATLATDLWILLRTFNVVVNRRGDT